MLDPACAQARFGLGLRPDTKEQAVRQFDRFDPRPAAFATAPDRATVSKSLADYLEATREARAESRTAGMGAPKDDPVLRMALMDSRKYVQQVARSQYLALVGARANAAIASPAPFVERMVHFWANHFAISTEKLQVIGLGGLLETEAIRPHVLGKFSEMLLAVEHHPAMLLYLDQAQSVGPDSQLGLRVAARGTRRVGLNENLAREIMELHTLGVRTGYGQDDVTELARAMTGWTVAGLARPGLAQALEADGTAGNFVFAPALHQPGARMILGRRYDADGENQARQILLDLAAHPATATHLATKLARHFAGDTPPPALVARLADRFTASGGDLPSVYRALLDAPELANAAPMKFKSPWDWMVSSFRALGVRTVDGQAVAGLATQLGQPVWRPGSPAGYDDTDATWAGPDALMRRVAAAARLAQRADASLDPRSLAKQILPGGGSPATLAAIARAENRVEGLALLLVSPEFMRR